MGLDMYLTARKYFPGYQHNENAEKVKFNEIANAAGFSIKAGEQGATSLTVEVKIGYWRKANAIHKWFVDNVQNGEDECQHSYVSRENLNTLLALCEKVKQNKDLAGRVLHCQSGFFFGATDYHDGYFEDIDNTIKIISNALNNEEYEDCDFYYQSSW